MASASTLILAILVAVIAAVAAYIYLFGIPADVKREMEEKALETMGENKASYLMKDAMKKIPESENRDVNKMKKNVADALGGSLQNPLGKLSGDVVDDATKEFTSR